MSKENNSVTIIDPIGELVINKKLLPTKEIPKPFSRDIFLFNTYIAGTTYIDDIEAIYNEIDVNTELFFYREPKNLYDKYAIVIKTKEGKKLGYVPAADNVVFARLMDAGKLLIAKIVDKEEYGSWKKIFINIFLRD